MHLHSQALRYLSEVARSGSIRKAAEQLNIASSAVNRYILKLEAELGVPIFERKFRSLRVTPVGQLLIDHIRRTLHDAEKTKEEIDELKGSRRGTVRLVVIEGLATDLLPRTLVAFREKYPLINFNVEVLPSASVADALLEHHADIGIAFNTPACRGIKREQLAELSVGILMQPMHPLAGQETITLADCTRYPLIMASNALSLAPVIEAALLAGELDPEALITTNSAAAVKAMVEAGLGIGFKSALGVEGDVAAGRLTFRNLSGSRLEQRLYLLTRHGSALPPSANYLIEHIKTVIDGMVGRLDIPPRDQKPTTRIDLPPENAYRAGE
jgi:DNA-binding transcriptional LysR family regulator